MAATNKARWMKKLTKAEINHLREMGVVSLRKARETFEWQAAQRRENEKKHPEEHCPQAWLAGLTVAEKS